MPDYRRAFVPGGTFFFTVVTFGRRPMFNDPNAYGYTIDQGRPPTTVTAINEAGEP